MKSKAAVLVAFFVLITVPAATAQVYIEFGSLLDNDRERGAGPSSLYRALSKMIERSIQVETASERLAQPGLIMIDSGRSYTLYINELGNLVDYTHNRPSTEDAALFGFGLVGKVEPAPPGLRLAVKTKDGRALGKRGAMLYPLDASGRLLTGGGHKLIVKDAGIYGITGPSAQRLLDRW